MRQKRIQGSHFANLKQAAAANQLVIERRIDPCMTEVFPWEQIPQRPHRDVEERAQARQHGGAGLPTTGLRTFEDVLEASKQKHG